MEITHTEPERHPHPEEEPLGHPRPSFAMSCSAERGDASNTSGRSPEILHRLLFLIEYSASPAPCWRDHRRHLSLFFTRHGGLHLLVMLLNAYYHKPAAGRRPGWVFSGLCDRIQISERGLRKLINDAMAQGLIEQLPVTAEVDRRCRSYAVTAPVVRAWEALISGLEGSMADIFREFDADAIANIDYRKWDPGRPAYEQVNRLPPSHRLRRST